MNGYRIFDGHNDTLLEVNKNSFFQGNPKGQLDYPRLNAAGVKGAIFSINNYHL